MFTVHFLILIALSLVGGLFAGLFLNCLAQYLSARLRMDTSQISSAQTLPATSPSALSLWPLRCQSCHYPLHWRQYIPLAGWIHIYGRCDHCLAQMPKRVPVLQILCALICVLCVWRFGFSWLLPAALCFSACVLLLCLTDLDSMLLPDGLSLGLLWSGLLLNTFDLTVDVRSAVWGAIFAWLSLWSLYWLFFWLTGREGMGYGDFKFAAALGAWLGVAALPALFLLASLGGIVVGFVLHLLHGRGLRAPLPFAPFLGAAGWLLLIGDDFLYQMAKKIPFSSAFFVNGL